MYQLVSNGISIVILLKINVLKCCTFIKNTIQDTVLVRQFFYTLNDNYKRITLLESMKILPQINNIGVENQFLLHQMKKWFAN